LKDYFCGFRAPEFLHMKRRILLVDDELAILLTLKAVLEINGFEVETAASAREAKSKLRNNGYHMVITDMRMESQTAGLEVARAAKKSASEPAVALLTAFPQPDFGWEDQGLDKMLVKPMNTEELLRQIEALLVTHEDAKQKFRTPTTGAGPGKAARGPASTKVARAR
jgi:DNA-binding response OmpR family regulator